MEKPKLQNLTQCSLFGTLGMGAGPLNWENQHVKYGNWEKLKCVQGLEITQTMSQDITKLNLLSCLGSLTSETPRKL